MERSSSSSPPHVSCCCNCFPVRVSLLPKAMSHHRRHAWSFLHLQRLSLEKMKKSSSPRLKKAASESEAQCENFLVINNETPAEHQQQQQQHQINAIQEEDQHQTQRDPFLVDFTKEQRNLVQETWGTVENHIVQIGLTTYLELFQKNPETMKAFPFLKHLSKEDLEFYSQLKNHAVRVTGVINLLVRQLELPQEEADAKISEFLHNLGRRHFSYGSRPHQMELLGHAFVETFMYVFESDPRKASIEEAWKMFFLYIVHWMKSGFEFVQNKGH